MSIRTQRSIEMRIVIPSLIFLFAAGCATDPSSKPLSGPQFVAAFKENCRNITGIEELHSSTWFTLNGTLEGEFTRAPFTLEEMSTWLRECGRDPKDVVQLLE